MKVVKQQNGMVLPFIVFTVVIVAVVGIAVWQFSRSEASTPSPSATPVASLSPSVTPRSSASVIKVTELGFEMTLPAGLTDLKYVAQINQPSTDGNGTISRASFSTTSLERLDSGNSLCLVSNAPIGIVVRYNAQPKGLDSGIPVRKLGNFYLALFGTQSACTDSNGAPSLESSQLKLLEEAFDSAAAL